jgi:tetratricopeptide (TPR) repeat protein
MIAAKVAELSGEAIQAEQLYRRAVRYYEKKHGDDSVQAAQVLMELGDFLEKKNRLSEAEECYERMRQILTRHVYESDQTKQS